MSVDTGSGADVGVAWNPAPRADPGAAPGVRSRSLSGRVVLGLGRWSGVGGVVEVRGPAACMRRGGFFVDGGVVSAVCGVDVGCCCWGADFGCLREVDWVV